MKPPLSRPLVAASLVFLGVLVMVAIFADLIASDVPLIAAKGGELSLLPEHAANWDWTISALFGRDDHVLLRVIHGARSSVLMTSAVLAIALTLGIAAGALAGYGPRLADALLARAVELSGAIPTLVLLAIVHSKDAVRGLVSFIAVVAVLRAIQIARLVRGEVLRVAGQDFILAARALGTPSWRIATAHVLPHVLGPALVAATFTAGSVVALEAALSFVGLGLPAEVQSWGALLGPAPHAPVRAAQIVPALAIVATTTACWVVADALDGGLKARRGRSRSW